VGYRSLSMTTPSSNVNLPSSGRHVTARLSSRTVSVAVETGPRTPVQGHYSPAIYLTALVQNILDRPMYFVIEPVTLLVSLSVNESVSWSLIHSINKYSVCQLVTRSTSLFVSNLILRSVPLFVIHQSVFASISLIDTFNELFRNAESWSWCYIRLYGQTSSWCNVSYLTATKLY
jgi:hypothetical protein